MFDMMWFTGTLCFAIGLCLGALLFSRFKSDTKRIRQLEEQMYQLARELQFEEAAQLRDEIQALRERLLAL